MQGVITLALTIVKLGVTTFAQSFLGSISKAFIGTISNIFAVAFAG